ncbi:MAG: hypothetical protein QXO71_04660, partial [Candidatus Jordarchaeaceae archaeon]
LLGINSNNSMYSRSGQPSILFIINTSNNYFADWSSALQSEGFNVVSVYLETLINNTSVASSFDVLILDTSCGGINQTCAQIIAGIGKPVLAVGNGGYKFLNHLGAQITPIELSQLTTIYIVSITTSDGWDSHYHIVYQYPNRVNYFTEYHYGQVSQRWFKLPLSNDSLTLANSSNLIPLAKVNTMFRDYLLSIYHNYSTNPYLLHWALHNITTISHVPSGAECFKTLVNTLHWLSNKNPYSIRIIPEYYTYNASQVANISIAAINNLNLSFFGDVPLNVTITDWNQSVVYATQIVTSSSQPVYISFEIPQIPSPSYTVNVTDGTLFFLESFTVQPTDYQVTGFSATPSTLYISEGSVLLNACVTVEGKPASGAAVYWSMINKIIYSNVTFPNNFGLYTILGLDFTNSSGYAAYNWVPQETGVYEVVAWIMNYDGTPKSWANASVIVRGKAELSVSIVSINPVVTVGNTLRFEGNLTLFSQPLGGNISINVSIYCPDNRVISYTIYMVGTGAFSFDWTPNTRGTYTIFFTYPGNLTMDSVTKGIDFSAYQIVTGLETSAKNGQVSLGESLEIKANFGSLGFTPNLNDSVTLLVLDIKNNNIVFSKLCTISNMNYFQTQWTPEYIGDYKIVLYFNQSYIIATPNSTIKVTSQESDSISNILLGISGISLGTVSDLPLSSILAVTGLGLLGSLILFTRLRKDRKEFFNGWLLDGSDAGGTEEDWEG